MNYFNYPYMSYVKPSFFGSLFKGGINWGGFFDKTQRVLNLVNQAVPIVKQVPPIYRNAKTMFKVMNEFRKVDTPQSIEKSTTTTPTTSNINNQSHQNTVNQSYEYGPTFFL